MCLLTITLLSYYFVYDQHVFFIFYAKTIASFVLTAVSHHE